MAMGAMSGDGHETDPNDACYLIEGGIPLRGEVRNSGAKNAATKLMVAALLTEDRCTIHNMPAGLGDVTITEEVLRALGADVTWPQESVASIRAVNLDNTEVPLALGRKNRLAVLTTRAAAAPRRQARSFPRPAATASARARSTFTWTAWSGWAHRWNFAMAVYHLRTDGLRGAAIDLPFPSVMATETLLIAATLARGVTIISNAAIEPEIIDLIKFLQKMGAIIEQRVDRKIVVEGVQRLHGADHRVITDRNEAVSLAIAAYLTHGDVRVIGADQGMLLTFLNTLYRVGLDFTVEEDAIRFFGER